MSQKYSSLTFELLNDFLQQMSAPTQLDSHALVSLLWETPMVRNHLALHPKDQTLPRGRIVGLALRSFLHSSKPPRLFAKIKAIWNKFLFLDVKYFYPFAHLTRFPKSYSELGVWLYDKDQLALVIADGDPLVAKRLAAENQDFWEALILDDAVPSPQTLSARSKASIKGFWKELIKQLELLDSLLSSGVTGANVSEASDETALTDVSIEHGDAQSQKVNGGDLPLLTDPHIQTSSELSLPTTTNISSDTSNPSQGGSIITSSIQDESLLNPLNEEAKSITPDELPLTDISPLAVMDELEKADLQKDADQLPVEDSPPPLLLKAELKIEDDSPTNIFEPIRRQMRQAEEEREEQTRQWASASPFLREYFARYNRGQQSSPYFRFVSLYGGEVSPQELDYIAWTVNWREFFIQQGIPCPTTDELYWRNDRDVVKNLLNVFAKTKEFDVQVKSAVLLRQCDLLARSALRLSLFKCRWGVVAEELARITVDLNLTFFRRSLAEAIIAKEDALLALVNCDTKFVPFVHKLALKIAKRLEYDFSLKKWFIASY